MKNKFKSIISSKLIYDSYNNISKGFGFVDLSDYNEYNNVLKSKEKINTFISIAKLIKLKKMIFFQKKVKNEN